MAAAESPAPEGDLEELTLEELLDVEVVAPTRTTEPLRAAPGVVTVITREEIVRSGARDLIDVLLLVPGFFFGVDVQGMVSVGFRGNWGEEGKVLLLLDGQELNETLYLTTQFGNHIPVEHIQRIEIIRGPGSVIYGGYAELAVINVITRSAEDLDGIAAAATYGQMDGVRGRTSLSIAAGHVFHDLGDLALTLSATVGDGIRSGDEYRDLFGNEYRLTNAQLDPLLVNLGATWKGLGVRFIFDDYRTRTRDAFDESLPRAVEQEFVGAYLETTFRWRLGETLALTPRLSYKRQTPWRVTERPAGEPIYYEKTAERFLGGLRLEWTPRQDLDLLVGGEAFTDRAELDNVENLGVGLQRPLAGGTSDHFETAAGFAQALWRGAVANLSLGVRYEHNSRFGGALLPRAGVTRVFGRFHAKVLYSRAFKAPGHENFALNAALRPERTTTYEVEAGYQMTEHLYLGGAFFDVTIRDPIIYFIDEATGGEAYVNEERTGTRGLEAECRVRVRRGSANLRYSFYTASGKNEVDAYEVPGRDWALRGWPAHKITLDGTLRVARGITVAPSVLYLGARYGTLDATAAGVPRVGREGPDWLVNLFVNAEDRWVEGLTVGAGVRDVLDDGLRFLQPYDSDHAPLPGPSREWVLRIEYRRPFE